MNIKNKFIAIASVLTLASLGNMAATNYGITRMDTIDTQLGDLSTLEIAQMEADMMHDALHPDAGELLAAMKSGDKTVLESNSANARDNLKRLDGALDRISHTNDMPANLADEIKTVTTQFADYRKDMELLLAATTVAQAEAAYASHDKHFEVLEKSQEAYEKTSNDLEKSLNAEQDVITSQTRILNNTIFCLTILLSIAVPVFAIRGLFRPLQQMMDAMHSIANGKTDTQIPHTQRTDEMGDMARTVEVFKENAQQVIKLAEDQKLLEQKATKDRRAAMDTLADGFEANVKNVVDMVASAATEMDATSKSVSHIAQNNQTKLKALTVQIGGTSRNVQTVAGATSQLSAAIQEISQQVNRASTITGHAVDEAKKADVTVQSLSDAATKIGEVVEMINSIAAQINLLALNATIEAARAGDAGKGFAVVASEVKGLATQTTKATEQIGQYITSIQNATGNTVSVIRTIGDTIREINEISTAIASAVEEQGIVTKDIAQNVQQAASGTEEVSRNTDDVSSASRETGEAATQMTAATTELSRQSEVLRHEVDKFLVGIRS